MFGEGVVLNHTLWHYEKFNRIYIYYRICQNRIIHLHFCTMLTL